MADHTQDWLVAASCCESPRPALTLADLPRAHRDELLRFAFVAAASSAFFIALYILLRPLPSRSLASPAALPHRIAPTADLLVAARVQTSADAPAPRTLRRRIAAPRPSYQVVDLEEPRAAAPPPKRRGDVVSRFFRSVFRRTVQPIKSDTSQ